MEGEGGKKRERERGGGIFPSSPLFMSFAAISLYVALRVDIGMPLCEFEATHDRQREREGREGVVGKEAEESPGKTGH